LLDAALKMQRRMKISPLGLLTFIDTLHRVGYSGVCQSGSLLKFDEFLGEWAVLP
jgi:hypothetical protein